MQCQNDVRYSSNGLSERTGAQNGKCLSIVRTNNMSVVVQNARYKQKIEVVSNFYVVMHLVLKQIRSSSSY